MRLTFETLEHRQLLAADADIILDVWPGVGHGDPEVIGPLGDLLAFTAKTPEGFAVYATDGDGFRQLTTPGTSRPEGFIRDGAVIFEQDGAVYSVDGSGATVLLAERPGAVVDLGTVYWMETTTVQLEESREYWTSYEDIDGRAWEGMTSIDCWYYDGHQECVDVNTNEMKPTVVAFINGDTLIRFASEYDHYILAAGSQDMWIATQYDASRSITVTPFAGSYVVGTHEGLYDDQGNVLADFPTGAPALTEDPNFAFLVAGTQIYTLTPEEITLVTDVAVDEWPSEIHGFGFAAGDYVVLTLDNEIYSNDSFQISADGTTTWLSLAGQIYHFGPLAGYQLTSIGLVGDGALYPVDLPAKTAFYPVGDLAVAWATKDSIETGRELTVRRLWAGDANLDGFFDSSDLLVLFTLGEYEDDLVGNSGWASGDFNGDQEFDSGDLVEALTRGWYRAE